MDQPVLCPICGQNNSRQIFGLGDLNKPLRNVICLTCTLVYINPRPDEATYLGWQKDSGRGSGHHTRTTVASASQKIKTSDRKMKQAVARYLAPRIYFGTKILDIGCGFGTLLDAIRKETNVIGEGIELNEADVAIAKELFNLNLFFGTLEKFAEQHVGRPRYDLIILHHTFEHLPDPRAALEQIQSLLLPEGLLYIAVPNIMNMKKRPELFFQAGHAFSYSPASISRLLSVAGFKIVAFNEHAAYPGGMELLATAVTSQETAVSPLLLKHGETVEAVVAYVEARMNYFTRLRSWREKLFGWLPAEWRIKIGRVLYVWLKKL